MPGFGEEEWVLAISRLRASANWEGDLPKSDSEEATYYPPPGWVVLETDPFYHSESNGECSVTSLTGGLDLITEENVREIYRAAMDATGEKGDGDTKAKLENEMKERIKEIEHCQKHKNTVRAYVSAKAHGDPSDRKRGWIEISVRVHIRYIGEPDRDSLAAEIKDRYEVDIQNLGKRAGAQDFSK